LQPKKPVQVLNNTAKNIEKWLQAAWYKPTLLSFLLQTILWPLSQVYRFLAFSNKTLYHIGVFKVNKISVPVAVPVVVVGNIVAGGGGKTPTVIALVQHLQKKNIAVGVISRGYGRTSKECLEVTAESDILKVGDEPAGVLLTCRVPIFVASSRFEAATALLKTYPATQVIVSDDGLQHHALQHDIAITVFDDRGMGNGRLLPSGPLRESHVKTTHSLVLHTGNHAAKLPNTSAPQFNARRALASYALKADGSKVNLSALNDLAKASNKPLVALAGIANPDAFFSMLREAGLNLFETVALPDHFDFNYAFDSNIGNEYAGYSLKSTVLCTVKDAVKLWLINPEALAIPLDFAPEAAFFSAFDAMLKPHLP
jgi:tetraacyldisaccharide 4'-kinase